MRVLALIINLVILTSSCFQERKIIQINNSLDFIKIIDEEVLFLKELDVNNKFNQYYVIQVKDLLYIINTNQDNLYSFMIVYDNITCEYIENEKIFFLKSISSLFDISSFYSVSKTPCNILVDYNSNPTPPNVNGAIFKIYKKSENFNLKLIKRGNISKNISNNKNFEIRWKILPEPIK